MHVSEWVCVAMWSACQLNMEGRGKKQYNFVRKRQSEMERGCGAERLVSLVTQSAFPVCPWLCGSGAVDSGESERLWRIRTRCKLRWVHRPWSVSRFLRIISPGRFAFGMLCKKVLLCGFSLEIPRFHSRLHSKFQLLFLPGKPLFLFGMSPCMVLPKQCRVAFFRSGWGV